MDASRSAFECDGDACAGTIVQSLSYHVGDPSLKVGHESIGLMRMKMTRSTSREEAAEEAQQVRPLVVPIKDKASYKSFLPAHAIKKPSCRGPIRVVVVASAEPWLML